MVERRQKKFVEAVPLQVTFTTDVMEDGSTAVLAEGSGYITTCDDDTDAFTPLLRHSVAELCRRRRPHPKCILAPGVSLDERHRRPNAEDVETIALIKAADINSLFSSVFCKDDLELPEEDVVNDKYGIFACLINLFFKLDLFKHNFFLAGQLRQRHFQMTKFCVV